MTFFRQGRRSPGYAVLAIAFFFLASTGGAVPQEKKAAPPAPPQGLPAAGPAQPAPLPAKGKAAAKGQPGAKPDESADGEYTEAITLATDRKVKSQLEAAQEDFIKYESWSQAAPLLQHILDSKEDVFIPVRRRSASGVEKIHQASARAEANRLLEAMPAKGKEFYELRYGAQAKALFVKAKAEGGSQGLRDVTRRFYFTEAGLEATELLGTYQLDRGRPHDAALCFKRLLERSAEGAASVAPATLFKAVLAFRRVGDEGYRALADKTWKTLSARIARDGLHIGDDVYTRDQLQQELDRVVPMDNLSPKEWAMFRGDATRTAQGRGSAPFLEGKWAHSSIQENVDPLTRQVVENALQKQYRTEPVLPAFFPIATRNKIIYRNYKGVSAVDAKTGELSWRSDSVASLDKLLHDSQKSSAVREGWLRLYNEGSNQGIIFENSTIGTLSTDNVRVYAVDDLGVPPYPSQGMQGLGFANPGMQIPPDLEALKQHDRLVAIELDSGKIVWELGDPSRDTSALAGSFFLGPPLPLAGQLYVLTEKNSELRLVCLDAAKGDLVWAQTLATARARLADDVPRRIQASHLAYGEGILVCPTNAGALLGFDIWSNSLVWAYPYREKSEQRLPARGRMAPGIVFPGGMPMAGLSRQGGDLGGEWKMSAPLVVDGKVIFTAPDGAAIHCLNLKDGDSLWQAERKDDLYLACVYQNKVVLVGKNVVRALSLADGKTKLWEVETGMPSGQGVASGSYYYLPLRKGEVCKIDLERGVVAAHSPSPKSESPGNLLFYEGDVISQTETALTAYPQVEFKVAQIDASLKKNPKDAAALTERGELRLYKGDLAGAVADLRDAIANSGGAPTPPKTRAKLYTTLTELLQRDFLAAEPYLDEYKELCKIDIPKDAPAEERQKLELMQRERQAGFLCLLARGREQQGRLVEAFQAYLDFGSLAQGKERIPVISEPTIQVQPDIWAQGRISALVARATPAQRQPLEAEIAKRWQKVKASDDLESLRRFVGAFGSLFAAGREARLNLAERLMTEKAYLEAELHLLQLRNQKDDPVMAARAVETLARLMTKQGLLEEAASYYRALGTQFERLPVRDGKSGADILQELSADKRFLPYLGEPNVSFFGASLQVREIPGTSFPPVAARPFDIKGEATPFIQRHRLAWSYGSGNGMNSFQAKCLDEETGEERWSLKSLPTHVGLQLTGSVRWPCYVTGHLAVFYLGHTAVGVNLVDGKKLWERDLLSPARALLEMNNQGGMQAILNLNPDLSLQIMLFQGTTVELGQIGAVNPSFVCLRTQEGLVALDPATGATLWTRSDLSKRTRVFSDGELLFLVEIRGQGTGGRARAIRGQDGATVEVPDFRRAYQQHLRELGGRLLVSENDPTGALVLRLYDIRLGKDLWKKSLPPNSVILQTDDPELLAFVNPKGQVTAFDLRKQREVFQASLAEGHMKGVRSGLLLEDAQQYYVVINRPHEGQGSGPFTNLNAGSLRSAPVNGMVYAFDKASAKLNWYVPLESQFVLLEQFADLPMMLFSATSSNPLGGVRGPVGAGVTMTETLSIDKRTGKRIWNKRGQGTRPFFSLHIDRQAGTFDLIASNYGLRHSIEDTPTRRTPSGDVRLPGATRSFAGGVAAVEFTP